MDAFIKKFLLISFIAMVLFIALLLIAMFFKFVVMLNCVSFLIAAAIASGVFGLTLLFTRLLGY